MAQMVPPLPFILVAVRVEHSPRTVHLVFYEMAGKVTFLDAIFAVLNLLTLAMPLTVLKLPLILCHKPALFPHLRLTEPHILAPAMPHIILIVAFVLGAAGPRFSTIPIPHIILITTRMLTPMLILVHTTAMTLIISPVARILITIFVKFRTKAVALPCFEMPLIHGILFIGFSLPV